MSSNNELDVEKDENDTYCVISKNRRKLNFRALQDIFNVYGEAVTFSCTGKNNIKIGFIDKNGALNCYNALRNHPDFMVKLPPKMEKNLTEYYSREATADFAESLPPNKTLQYSDSPIRYVCKCRRIIHSTAFKCVISGISSLNKRLQPNKNNLISEVKLYIDKTSLDFEVGFEDDVQKLPNDCKRELVLARDLYYFQITRPMMAVDVLISCLPPWYEQVDLYKLVLPLVPDDLLRIDWYKVYNFGSNECSHPYAIVFVKTQRAASVLRYCADDLVVGHRKISVLLMEDIENMLLDIKKQYISESGIHHTNLVSTA